MQRLILYATSSLFSITICTKLFRSFDRYIPILTLNFEGILCLISRINALFIVFIRHDFAKFLRNIDLTCFCLYRKICKCFFRNTECNITKAAANLILTGKCNILPSCRKNYSCSFPSEYKQLLYLNFRSHGSDRAFPEGN